MENPSWKALLPLLLVAGCSTVGHQWHHLTSNVERRLADDVVIERDGWGVPHISGRSDEATVFGAAWAMAEDDYPGVEESYMAALGRSAYYYGMRYLADDLVRAAFRVEALARAEYAREPAAGKRLLDAFAQGLNYWVRKHPDATPRVVTRYEGWMVLARARHVFAAQRAGSVRLGEIATLVGEPNAGARTSPADGPGTAWAIPPARSATGHALLLASMAGQFFGSDRPYEMELRSETGWHVYGFAALGTPVPHTAHNDQLGWAHSRVTDAAVLRELFFGNPADSLAYRAGASWERAEPWLDTVYVNTAGGVQAKVYGFMRTAYGPVIARRGDTAFAVQIAGMDAGGSLQQWAAMGRARSRAEFAAAFARGALPGLATAYADAAGNIMTDDGGGGALVVNPPAGGPGVVSGRSGRALLPDSGWTVSLLARFALGTAPLNTASEIQQLVHEWEQVGGRNSRRAFAMDTAVEMLRRWNGRTAPEGPVPPVAQDARPVPADSASSTAASLYYVWQDLYRTSVSAPAAGKGVAAPVPAFPRFQALEEAVAGLRREWGRLEVPWSELVRLERPTSGEEPQFQDDLPSTAVAGFPDGTVFVLNTSPGNGRRRYAASGTAAVLVTELAPAPRSESAVVFGQSAAPASRHFFDQAALFAAGALKQTEFGSGSPGRARYHPGQRVTAQSETSPRRSP